MNDLSNSMYVWVLTVSSSFGIERSLLTHWTNRHSDFPDDISSWFAYPKIG